MHGQDELEIAVKTFADAGRAMSINGQAHISRKCSEWNQFGDLVPLLTTPD
jgi:hypothetical protein